MAVITTSGFIYLLVGLYLLAPFLKRIVDHASGREVLVLIGIILLPTTLLPLLEGLSPIPVRPIPAMLEGLTGYFLLGWLLGSQPPRPTLRPLIYLERRLPPPLLLSVVYLFLCTPTLSVLFICSVLSRFT